MSTNSKILYGGLQALGRELAKEEWQGVKYTILLDENTFQHCLPLLISSVEALQEAEFIEVPVGEECKSLEVAAQVWQTLLEGGADRQQLLVNLGGGAVCDLGGFVAAGYKRGIRHINIPTTLLGMVDAAIGGKTAIDFGGVKNSIGHFYPAVLTVIEPAFLDTLPEAELLNGQMEMVKTAAVTDPALFSQLIEDNSQFSILNSQLKLVARLKARVVKADPYDHSVRKILNFGHTFGHAIEVYRGLPHGLAVGVGMKVAMYLSTKKLGLAEEVYQAYSQWLKEQLSRFTFHFSLFNLKDIEQMLPLMHQDKKNTAGSLRCVLLQELGAPVIDVEINDNEVRDALLRLHR
ncbi:MAG: 3-dehydroquinate synthase [Bacteroidales bacterium]|nr:3-dehydroquinate synthase [Bacteroidales bacterium]